MIEPGRIEAGSALANQFLTEIGKAVLGQNDVVRQVLLCLLASGHVLIEGVPGLGKTLLVRALTACFKGTHSRVQFTPDLMPSDVTGHSVFNMKTERFEVRRGPVFTHLLLADEINRAPAKTQAALLEVMQEHRVTIEGDALPVPAPFMVLATQNPIEQDGTYPLPEAELDRFMMKVRIDYPGVAEECALVDRVTTDRMADILNVDDLATIADAAAVLDLQQLTAAIAIDAEVLDYAVRLARCTRAAVGLQQGAGPRASIALVRVARAAALLAGRDFVLPDDVKAVALPVLRHRVQITPDLEIEGQDVDVVLTGLLDAVDAPRR